MKTNKLIYIAALILLVQPFTAGAQVSIGTRHGIAVSTLSKIGNLCDNDHLTLSYTGGVFATIPLVKQLSLQPELNYIRKGRCNETTITGTTYESDYNYNYLQIPVMMRYATNLTGNSKSNIFFNAGPYAAILLRTENKLKSGGELPETSVSDTKKDPDLGLVLGGGVIFPVNKLKIQMDLRYDMGLTKLNNQPDDYRTKSLSLAVGILF